MRRIRAMSLGIELIINNGVSSSGRIPDITGEAGQVNSILADRLRKSKLCMKDCCWKAELFFCKIYVTALLQMRESILPEYDEVRV